MEKCATCSCGIDLGLTIFRCGECGKVYCEKCGGALSDKRCCSKAERTKFVENCEECGTAICEDEGFYSCDKCGDSVLCEDCIKQYKGSDWYCSVCRGKSV